jgi:hypothetical protein
VKPQELWKTLHAAGLLRREEMPAAAPRAPWYMEAMLFLAFWTGAEIVVFAFASLFEVDDTIFFYSGGALCALASWLFHAHAKRFFLVQLAHASSLCGAGLILFACAEIYRRHEGYILLALALLVFCLMNNFVQRLVATVAALFAIAMICHKHWGMDAAWLWLDWMTVGCCFAFVLAWWMEMKTPHYRQSQLWRGVGYALALFLLGISVFNVTGLRVVSNLGLFSDIWENAAIVSLLRFLPGLALLCFVTLLLRREGMALHGRPALILMGAALCVAFLGMKMPHIAIALLILVTGFAASAPVLLGIGAVLLLCVFAQYYYWLEVSLLDKSIYLMLTGGALLACRLALLKILPRPGDREQETGDRELPRPREAAGEGEHE